MKHKNWMKKIYALILMVCMLFSLLPVSVMAEPSVDSEIPEDAIYLSTPEDVIELAEDCRVNAWSQGKTVVLENDIDMSNVAFRGIPTFGGTFLGQGHTIKGVVLNHEGSVVGLFRYLQKTAIVEQLHLEVIAAPEGSKRMVGGLVGSNAGTIRDCIVTAIASGYEQIGAITGINTTTGMIENCVVNGMVYGSHFVGGIAGENQGVIRRCTNHGEINTQSVQNSVSIEDITLDSLMNTENASTTTDIGGVVGINTGVVRACTNYGSIGYQSMGFNIGGIAGTQSGYMVSCVNHADVQGRKEVGGIVGHMEPNIVVEFDEDTLQTLSGQMSDLETSMKALEGSIKDAADEMEQQLDDMEDNLTAVEDSIDELSDATEDFSDSMETVMDAVEAYADAANALMDEIEKIADSEETTAIKNKIEELEKALEDLEKSLNIDEVMTNYEKVSTLMSELLKLVGVDDSEGTTDISKTIDEMQKIIDGLANAKNLDDVKTNVEKLNAILDDLQKAFDEISKNSGEIKTKINELSTALEQLSNSMNLEEVKTNYEKVTTLFEDLEKMIDTSSSTNTPILEEKLEDLDDASEDLDKALNDDGLSANYDKVVAATNNLGSALEDLSTESKKMTEELEDATSGLSDKLDAITAQMDRISATMKGAEEGIQLTLEDISAEDTKEDTVGKVYRCTNYGEISGDLNIGGIAGIMAEENDLDEEADTEIYGEESLNATGKARVVIRECENYGTISAGKQYVGGIVGYMLIGAVLDSFNMGSLDALNADYVGGIVGSSNAVVRGCSSKCILAGDVYVGGIAGLGNEVTGCYAFIDIQAFTEKAGMILGAAKERPEATEEDIVVGNYYYAGNTDIGGIDGISYKGATDKKSLKKFLKLSDIPTPMKTVEVRFVAEGQEDVVLTVKVGDSLKLDAIPTLSVEADSEYEWEIIPAVTSEKLGMGEVAHVEYLSEHTLTNIRFNQTYQASFDLKDTVIQGEEKVNGKLAQILAEGTFAKNTTIALTDMLATEPAINDTEVVENWQVAISNTGVSKLHYHIPEGLDIKAIRLYVKDASGNWVERDYLVEGTYLVFDFADGETGFAIEKNLMVYAWRLVVVALAVLILLIVARNLSKKRKLKKNK